MRSFSLRRWQIFAVILIHFLSLFFLRPPNRPTTVTCTFHIALQRMYQFASSMTTATASSYGSGDNQTMHDISQQREDATINYEQLPSVDCILPSYFNHFAVLILIATTIITQLSHLTKIIIMTVFTFTYCLIDGFLFDTPFRHEVNESWNPWVHYEFERWQWFRV